MQKRFTLFILFLLTMLLVDTTAYAHQFKKNVIIFSSYHHGYEWNDNIEDGITSVLKKQNVNIKMEYLDSLNANIPNYYDNLLEIYKSKYRDNKFDLIICSDNAAYNFFLDNKEKLFPNIPLVFTGLNNFKNYESNSKLIKNSTGILDDIDIGGNIDLVLSLHPKIKNIFILIDKTFIGNAISDDIKNLKNNNTPEVNLNIIDTLTLEDTLNIVNKNPKENVILYASTSLSTNCGNTLYPVEAILKLKNKTIVPIYGVWDILLDKGIIGGKITSSYTQGVKAGIFAKRILNGERAENIPIDRNVDTKYIFDYKEVTNSNMNLRLLPSYHSLINEPTSVYSISKKNWSLISYLVLSIFLCIIVLLFINIQKRKGTEKKLKDSEIKLQHNFNFLKTLLNTIPTPIFSKDTDGKYTDCNSAFEDFIGLKKEDILSKTVKDICPVDSSDIHAKVDSELISKKGTKVYETKIMSTSGKNRDVIFNKSTIVFGEEPIGTVGVMLDITDMKKNEDRLQRLSIFKEAMIEVNQAIIRVGDINELFNLILKKSTDIMKGAEYGSVLLLNDYNHFKVAASIGYDGTEMKNFNLPLDNSFHYLKTNGNIKNTIIIDNIKELYHTVYVNCAKNWTIVSSISTPIVIDNKLFGMLNIDSDKIDTFDEDDIYIMNYMKNQIENAIYSHNLYNEIIYLSKYDKLTNIYNRGSFEEVFDRILTDAKKYNTSFFLVIFDLNDLKLINDNYGHLEGDKYISNFTNKLKTSLSDCSILARYGGDEFVGVFFDTTPLKLLEQFEEINEYFTNNPVIISDTKIKYSFSYGIASFPSEAKSYSQLIKIADKKMYSYKDTFKKHL